MHHTIEERHIFPLLAKYMPRFGIGADEVHIKSHRAIHDGTHIRHLIPSPYCSSISHLQLIGLENLEKLVAKWKADPSKYSPTEMRACLDGFRDVLFDHLDEEV